MATRPGLRWTRLLDPRPRHLSEASPWLDSVNLPAEDLAQHPFELPPPGRSLAIGDGEGASVALGYLSRRNRCEIVTPKPGPAGRCRLWEPSPLVPWLLDRRLPGRVIDLGCGSGRDAVELASAGWDVVGVDHLPDALDQAAILANRYGLAESTAWVCGDACHVPELAPSTFDLAILIRFFDREALTEAVRLVGPGGWVAVMTFGPAHRQRTGKPAAERAPSLQLLEEAHPWARVHLAETQEHDGASFSCFVAEVP